MPVPYTSAKALLVSQATALAAEATLAGLTSLSSSLTNLASEISGATVTEDEFFGNTTTSSTTSGSPPVTSTTTTNFGSAAVVWAGILNAASQTILAHNSNAIATDTTAIAAALGDDSTTILGLLGSLIQAIENVEKHQQKIRELAEGPGIRMIGPYEWLGFIPSYINYIEKGEILETEGEVSAEQIAAALAKFRVYFEKINSLPTNF